MIIVVKTRITQKIVLDIGVLLVSAICLITEWVYYPGIIHKLIGLPITLLFAVALIVLSPLPKVFQKLFMVVGMSLGLAVTLLYFIEIYNYPNYIYSTYHISLETMTISASFIITLALKAYFNTKYDRLVLSASIILLFISLNSLYSLTGTSIGNLSKSYLESGLNIEEKYPTEFQGVIKYYRLVNKQTPADAKILLPPESIPWKYTGNLFFTRYFIYPRNLFHGQLTSPVKGFGSFNFLILSSEEYPAGSFQLWPNFPVPAKNILVFNLENQSVTKYPGPYNPADWVDTKPWGLLEL